MGCITKHGLHNPVDIRHAGRSYQHANVGCRGAFHPKLVVLLGEHDVWIAIGSGNPTTAGWGYNDELWIVIRSPRTVGPNALVQLGNWLVALARHPSVRMPSWIAAALTPSTRNWGYCRVTAPPTLGGPP